MMWKKAVNSLVLASAMIFSFSTIQSKAEDRDFLGDYGYLLDYSQDDELSDKLSKISDFSGIGVYIYTDESFTNNITDISEYSDHVYSKYNLGFGEDRNGVLLTLVTEDNSYDVKAYGSKAEAVFTDDVCNDLEYLLTDYVSSGNYYIGFINYCASVSSTLGVPATGILSEDSPSPYIVDNYGILYDSEVQELTEKITPICEKYDVGLYIYIEPNYENGNYNIEAYSEYLFFTKNLGMGNDRNSLLLTIVMSDRSYDISGHGTKAHYAFTDYARGKLEDVLLDDLREDNYYRGFSDYIEKAEYALSLAEAGTPLDVNSDPARAEASNKLKLGLTLGLPPIVSIMIVLILLSKHKSTHIAKSAESYIPKNGVHLTQSNDFFLYKNRTVRHIPRNNSGGGGGGGGTSVNSGGFSHSSGHF